MNVTHHINQVKKQTHALTGEAQSVGALSPSCKGAGLIPSRGTSLGCGFDPRFGHVQPQVWVHTGSN